MDILEIIDKKRNKQDLSYDEIKFFINGYTKEKTIKDYQASALLMAIAINGMNDKEIFNLTKLMLESGKIIDFSKSKGIKIDKHSTGGVGDKVSLILAPICVALGIKVAKLSGKGLGHTGGTIDKLEAIGVDCYLKEKQYVPLLNKVGMFIGAQTDDLVVADKYLYALRNSTSTVQSIPLIASSVASKKLALKTDYVFIDVKVGDGGFSKTIRQATTLSKALLQIFKSFKRNAIIHITNMTQPLGRAIGNAIEVKAAIDFLKGNYECNEIKELIYEFACDILISTHITNNKKDALNKIDQVIKNGAALKIFYDWVRLQGANMKSLKNDSFFNPKYKYQVKANRSGYLNYKSTKEIGMCSFLLGAGRLRKEDSLDYQAGIWLNKIKNEHVNNNDVIATLYSSKPIKKECINNFVKNVEYSNNKYTHTKEIVKVMK